MPSLLNFGFDLQGQRSSWGSSASRDRQRTNSGSPLLMMQLQIYPCSLALDIKSSNYNNSLISSHPYSSVSDSEPISLTHVQLKLFV